MTPGEGAPFKTRVSQKAWLGPVFCVILLLTVVITNVPLRGLWSFLVLLLLLILALGIALVTAILLWVGGFLFMGEWLFGSIGWGLAHGLLTGISLIVVLALVFAGYFVVRMTVSELPIHVLHALASLPL